MTNPFASFALTRDQFYTARDALLAAKECFEKARLNYLEVLNSMNTLAAEEKASLDTLDAPVANGHEPKKIEHLLKSRTDTLNEQEKDVWTKQLMKFVETKEPIALAQDLEIHVTTVKGWLRPGRFPSKKNFVRLQGYIQRGLEPAIKERLAEPHDFH